MTLYRHEEDHQPHTDEREDTVRHEEGHHRHTEEPAEPGDSGPNKFIVGLLTLFFIAIVLVILVVWQP